MKPMTSNPTTMNLTTSNSTTMAPSSSQRPSLSPSPSQSPSLSQSPSQSQYCFPDRTTLKTAVNNYINQNCATNTTCPTCTQYGEIGTWCVKLVTDMAELFYGKSTFNSSDISRWDVSSVTNMFCMFYEAYAFSSDISNWNVSSVTDSAEQPNVPLPQPSSRHPPPLPIRILCPGIFQPQKPKLSLRCIFWRICGKHCRLCWSGLGCRTRQ